MRTSKAMNHTLVNDNPMQKNHHLAYLCSSKSWGGMEINQLKNAIWMQRRGHKVSVLTLKNSRFYQEAEKAGMPILIVPQPQKYLDIKGGAALLKIVKSEKISHLIVRDPKEMSMASFAKRLGPKSFFLAYFMEMQIGIPKKDWVHTLRYKPFDLWSCPLPWLQQQVVSLTKFPASKTTIIPSGIELENFYNAPNKTKAKELLELDGNINYIGLAGRLDPQKGQLLLLDAFNQLQEKEANYNVVFLGEPTFGEYADYPQVLDDFIKASSMQGRVHFRPFREDIATFYAAMDIFVMGTKSETFGMVTVEAMASGCKIVGSNKGGTVEILDHGKLGYLYESENAGSLAENLEKAIHDPQFDAQKVRRAAQTYDHHAVCELVESALNIK